MRLIIGIIFGILIVFNWSSIRKIFDSSLANQSQKPDTVNAAPAPTPGQAVPAQPVIPQSLSGSVEQRLKEAAAERK
jgi:hypothetical protein